MRIASAALLIMTSFSVLGSLAVAGENYQESAECPKQRVPFLLCQRSVSAGGVSSLIRTAHDWKLDGVDLDLDYLLKEAGSRDKLSELLVKIPPEQRKDIYFHLAITARDQTLEALVEDVVTVTNHLPLKSCSVANPDLAAKLLEKLPGLKFLVENGDLVSGVAVDRFISQVRQSPEPIGVLIKSASVRYRFDLCLLDVWQKIGASPSRPVAVRFRCDTTQVHNSSIAEFNREMFRRSLARRAEPSGIQQLFVSIEANRLLPSDKAQSAELETMQDMIQVLRDELLASH